MIERDTERLSIRTQCSLLSIHRSGIYYVPKGVSESDVTVMRMIDEHYTRTPYYGVERMTKRLHRDGVVIGHNRVRRLLRLMGLVAVYPKRKTSNKHPEHKIYPYLLGGVQIERINQVWSADITYIRLSRGFVYLVAIIDWFSRYVLAWSVSITLESQFCVDALEEALSKGKPEIFNTDQGSQFTSADFTGKLKDAGIQISMDGKGRVFDNIFVERLWRSVKYEEVYLNEYVRVRDAVNGIGAYMDFYNNERLHQSLEYKTPAEIHLGKLDICYATRSIAEAGKGSHNTTEYHPKQPLLWS